MEPMCPRGPVAGRRGGLIQRDVRSVKILEGGVCSQLGLNLNLQPKPDGGMKKMDNSIGPPADCNFKWVCLSCTLVCGSAPGFSRRPPESSECLMQRQTSLKHHYLDDGMKDAIEMKTRSMTCILGAGINSRPATWWRPHVCVI